MTCAKDERRLPEPRHRDTFKTAGEIRAAAFGASHPEYAHQPVNLAELHDSICCALPSDGDTPASVSRAAADTLDALKAWDAAFLDFDPESQASRMAMRKVIIQGRAAIARAEGAS